jgi:multiple sugar transport system permease protein
MATVRSTRKAVLNRLAIAAALIATLGFLGPIYWIASTAFKPKELAITVPPTVVFTPEITPMIRLFTKRVQIQGDTDPAAYAAAPWWEKRIYDGGERVLKVGNAVQLSQYPNLLFFILSTRMLPPVVVAIPMFLMYRVVGLNDSHIGLIILYVAFNLSFSVWLMKGFMDEIPREYEEAALVDGYTRMQSFFKIVLPEAATGIAATAVFCFITAWNEYAFALIMTNRRAQTAPPFIPSQIGSGLPDWTTIAAGTFLFLLPVAIFTFALRRHLLRGVTFGAIRK